jgi:hypothetical protein
VIESSIAADGQPPTVSLDEHVGVVHLLQMPPPFNQQGHKFVRLSEHMTQKSKAKYRSRRTDQS